MSSAGVGFSPRPTAAAAPPHVGPPDVRPTHELGGRHTPDAGAPPGRPDAPWAYYLSNSACFGGPLKSMDGNCSGGGHWVIPFDVQKTLRNLCVFFGVKKEALSGFYHRRYSGYPGGGHIWMSTWAAIARPRSAIAAEDKAFTVQWSPRSEKGCHRQESP